MNISLSRGVNSEDKVNIEDVLSKEEMWDEIGVMNESKSWRLEGIKVS